MSNSVEALFNLTARIIAKFPDAKYSYVERVDAGVTHRELVFSNSRKQIVILNLDNSMVIMREGLEL